MSFAAFQLYLFFLFLRPIELFAQWMVPYRPMLVLWLFAFGTALVGVVNKKNAAATGTHYALLAVFTLIIFASLVFRYGLGMATGAVSEFSASALLFVLVSFNLVTIERVKAACLVILLSMGLLSVAGISAYHTGYMAEELVLQQRKNEEAVEEPAELPDAPAHDTSGVYMWRVRGVGFFNDPNDFAQALVMTMPMLWWFYRPGRWRRNLLVIGLPAAVIGYTVFLTNSRGALLGMASLMFFGVRSVLGTTRTAVLMAVLGAGALLGNMTGGRGFSSQEESASGRIEAWYEGFQMLKSSPVLGVGFGNFTEYHWLTAHNSFVLCFAELGLAGYFVWLALIVLSYKAVNAVVLHAPAGTLDRTAGLLLRSSLIGYLTCAWFLSRSYQPVLFALMALCAATWACARRNPALPPDSPLRQPLKWGASTLLFMFLTMLAVYLFIFMHSLQG